MPRPSPLTPPTPASQAPYSLVTLFSRFVTPLPLRLHGAATFLSWGGLGLAGASPSFNHQETGAGQKPSQSQTLPAFCLPVRHPTARGLLQDVGPAPRPLVARPAL